jgi:mannose-6-phosphate isomerase-like protein (cupin superfamily)
MPASPLVGPGDGRTVRFPGFGTRYVVTGDQTAGALAVVEHDLAPRALGAPLHVHEREDEISHVLAGRLGVQVGDDVVEAGPGDTVLKPRGIPHAFWNPGDEPVRFLELIAPAGFERYFEDVAPLIDAAGPPDLGALTDIMRRYAMTMDFGSMDRLIAEHGLEAPPGS